MRENNACLCAGSLILCLRPADKNPGKLSQITVSKKISFSKTIRPAQHAGDGD
jgi:hypothetical protein